jgi:hypothetical protein
VKPACCISERRGKFRLGMVSRIARRSQGSVPKLSAPLAANSLKHHPEDVSAAGAQMNA